MTTSRDVTEKYTILGCMSGTSVDGIDLAILTTDGREHIEYGPTFYVSYTDDEREAIRAAFLKRMPDDVTIKAEDMVTMAHVKAIQDFQRQKNISYDYIAFHGQTISHDPSQKFTWQIGDAQKLSSLLSIPVIYDFRGYDVSMGGQGAPLLPVFHRALLQTSNIKLPSVVINIGGVSNITYLSNDDLIAFDSGPGNALIDDQMKTYFKQSFDENGSVARQGTCDQNILNQFLDHDFFKMPYPKSLDRNAWNVSPVDALSPQDKITTLTMFTVEAIVKGIEQLPQKPLSIYVTGGGRHNQFMMETLATRTSIHVQSVDVLGWNGDFIEAQGFAYMGARFLSKLPISFPLTTGAPEPLCGGKITYPE